MNVTVVWAIQDWVRAVANLPEEGPLPCRVVLVPRMSVAHALRRELARAGAPVKALAGTRFLTRALAATEVLRAASVTFESGEEALRPARLLALFRSEFALRHFPLDLLRSKPGWHEAFARTISDLEAAGARPESLERADGSEREQDVARIWHALDESADRSWTIERACLEAATVLEERPGCWPFEGHVLTFATSSTTGAEARFCGAIPKAELVLLAARPARTRFLDRMGTLFGDAARQTIAEATVPRSHATERDLVASYLFEQPVVLADPGRPRSSGPDGTVDLEEQAAVEAEIEATADWVARQIAAGTPLEEVAVLMPMLDPIAGLVTDRLARLPWQGNTLPVHVAGGLPLTGFATGARALAVVRALRAHLSAEALADVLPALRCSVQDRQRLSHGAAMELVWTLGTTGGNAARPEGALEWSTRAAAREGQLERQLADLQLAETEKGAMGHARRVRELERRLAGLRAARPAIDGLATLARHAVEGAPLAKLWPLLRSYLEEWLPQPGTGPRVHVLLDERLGTMASDLACGTITAADALRLIEETVASTRVPVGRFGDPAVYLGTTREAIGLRFQAVRVIGLAEGHLPAVPREDPVLPDAVRIGLARDAGGGVAPVMEAADHAIADLHALDTVIRNATARISLSAPRVDQTRSQREPSFVILETAAALARPNRSSGERGGPIPDMAALRRDGFAPAREAAARFRSGRPLAEAAWQDGVASRILEVPPRWRSVQALDLDRVTGLLSATEPTLMDGLIGTAGVDLPVPGVARDWAISPGGLATLLQCPHAFLLGNLLGFQEPPSPPPQREIGQPDYGQLFHLVAARFYERYGGAFCAREGSREEWLTRADEIIDAAFDTFLEHYPLVGQAVQGQQRGRLRRDVRDLLRYDWDRAGSRFVAAERVFGAPDPVELHAGERSLFLRGRIDRLDVENGRTLVRDLKTGRPHPRLGREADPDPRLDLQLAIYGLVAKVLSDTWKTPEQVAAAYAYIGKGAALERSFRDDFHEALEPAAAPWLEVAARLLANRLFPRTPNPDDCTFCRFRPVCGDAYERAAAILANAEGALADFGAFKGIGSEG